MLQVTLNVLNCDMTMLEAVSAPRVSAISLAVDVSNRVPRSVERELGRHGYEVVRSPNGYTFAWVHGIKVGPDGLERGADPATDGMAFEA